MNIKKLEKIGGNRWAKGSNDRIYFNNIEDFIGLSASFYSSGNVRNAKLNGSPISNCEAKSLIMRLSSSKVYFDINTESFEHTGELTKSEFEVIVANIKIQASGIVIEESEEISQDNTDWETIDDDEDYKRIEKSRQDGWVTTWASITFYDGQWSITTNTTHDIALPKIFNSLDECKAYGDQWWSTQMSK